MPTWDGFFSTDFLAPINWVGGILPNENSAAVIDSTGAGAQFNPTLLAGQSASVFTLEQSDRNFTVQGTLTVNAGAIVSGAGSSAGILIIANTGTVSVSGNGLTVTGGFGVLNNFGTLGSKLQVSGGAVNNAGVITGAVTVSGGSLTLNPDSDLSDSAVLTVNTGGTVTVNAFDVIGGLAGDGGTVGISNGNGLNIIGAANTAFSGVISGAGFLQFGGTGTRTLSGTNTYSGGTFIDGGTLQIGAGGTTGTLGSGAVVNNGALVFDRSIFVEVANAISGTGTLRVTSGDVLILAGTNTYSGTTTINTGGSLVVGPTGTLGTGAVTNNGALEFNRPNVLTVANVISGTGAFIKVGAGILTLSGASTFTGATTVSRGTLNVTGSIASQNVSVFISGRLQVDGAAISDGATVTLNDSGNLNLTGSERIGALVSASGTTTVTLGANTLTTGNAENRTFAGVISGTGGLTKQGAGALTLSGTNTHTGLTRVSLGTLIAATNGALGTTAAGTVVAPGATLALQGGITTAEAIALSGSGVAGNGAIRNIAGVNTLTGAITLNGAAEIQADADRLNINGTVTGGIHNLTLETVGTSTIAVSGAITGSGALTKTGASTLTLSGANTFTGATTVNGGTLQVSAGNGLSATGLLTVNSLGRVRFDDTDTVGGLAGSGSVRIGNGIVLTLAPAAGTRTFSGVIANADPGVGVALAKAGAGIQVLSGANTYTGTTTVNAGLLDVTGSLASLGTIVNGGSLRVNGSTLADTAAVTLNGSGNLTLSGS
ncbi:autotransporter-associated beta strand repeat-containing protein [Synechococcus sp. CS-1325]|uniref:autotransporter-associated beta strand repeat-containing protein n=1 Tax=Synechococcus sp. CS-1325 TaxID=2847979 RepID=UPI000DB64B05|nr:autotransporter-associated beta strand repeat-containing protein [Synechococcus sp. CS-1325]MCT0198269.1 autotransporter-associated beta strand repeat-containing protein [Synechococcus sp. CS-1325]PZV00698.1 MAG: hypothetical protein DCF24_06360 [Cyanobium sp.]